MKTESSIKGWILAGSQREYYYYLYRERLKGREYPQLTMFVQLKHFHDVPPIVCVGTYFKHGKYVEIRRRAEAAGITVTNATIKQ